MFSRFQRHLLSLATAMLATSAAHAAAPMINEGFDNVGALASQGWVMSNNSSPAGSTTWYQDVQSPFMAMTSHDGASNSFIAANYDSASAGGMIDNWLITPTFSTAVGGTVTFWAQGAADAGYADTFKVGFSDGSSAIGAFTTGALVTATQGTWTEYSFTFSGMGAGSVGRFAIEYTGAADGSDMLGIDRLQIAAVPEPATTLMLGVGLLGLAASRRRRAAR